MKNMPTAEALQAHFQDHAAGNITPENDDQGVGVILKFCFFLIPFFAGVLLFIRSISCSRVFVLRKM